MKKIAVLWNYSYFHESVLEIEYGPQWYRKIGNGPQPEAIDVQSIMNLAEQTGEIVVNHAYGDWQNLGAYATVLRQYGIRLLQFFPQPRGKQDAVSDELILDTSQLIQREDGPDVILIVGGNNKLLALCDLAKERNIEVLTVSIASPSEREWEDRVDQYIAYRSIARPIQGEQQVFKDPRETHDFLITTFLDLRTQYGNDWIRQVKIKPILLRHAPDFQESDYGYSSFGAFLGDQREIIDRRQLPNAREAEYCLLQEVIPENALEMEVNKDSPESLVPYYLRVAAQQGVRMPPPETMWVGIDIYASFLESGQVFDSFSDLDDECLDQLRHDLPKATLTDAKKIRQVLFKCYLFRPSKDGTIGFQDEIQSLEDIEDRYFRLMLARIGNHVKPPVNYEAMSLALTGESKSAAYLETLHPEVQ